MTGSASSAGPRRPVRRCARHRLVLRAQRGFVPRALWALIAIDPSACIAAHPRPQRHPDPRRAAGGVGRPRAAPHRRRCTRSCARSRSTTRCRSLSSSATSSTHPTRCSGGSCRSPARQCVRRADGCPSPRRTHPIAVRAGAVTAATMTVMAFSTSTVLTFAIAVPFGAGVAAFIAASNSIFAERTSPDMRPRARPRSRAVPRLSADRCTYHRMGRRQCERQLVDVLRR